MEKSDKWDAFKIKKSCQMAFCLISIVASFLLAIIQWFDTERLKELGDLGTAGETFARIVVIVEFIINCSLLLLGLCGAIYEHFCITVIFAIINGLFTLGFLFASFAYKWELICFFPFLITTIVAVLFALELHKLRKQREQELNPNIQNTVNPQNTANIGNTANAGNTANTDNMA